MSNDNPICTYDGSIMEKKRNGYMRVYFVCPTCGESTDEEDDHEEEIDE